MSGMHKGVATRMKECCPFALYVHCYGHLLNLAIQDTMTQIEPVRNALGTIQNLYNFLEASPKRHAIFVDIQSDLKPIVRSLKSLSVTRWSCHWEAVKAVHEELESIVMSLLSLADKRDVKIYTNSRALLRTICDFGFVLGLCVLKVILGSTSSLSKYLQGEKVDVMAARRNASSTIKALQKCRNESNFKLLWKKAELLSKNMKVWIADTEFTFKDPKFQGRNLLNVCKPC